MKYLPLIVALSLGCSGPTFDVGSEPVPPPDGPVADTGRESAPADSASPPDAGDAGISADSNDTGWTKPDTVDTGSPPDTGTDTGAGVDATDSAPPSAEELECAKGAPRLVWDGAKCRDTSYGFDCAWLRASDGVERCMPPAAHVAGYKPSSGCLPVDVGYVDATSGSLASVEMPGSSPTSYRAVYLSSSPRPPSGGWKLWSSGSCVLGTSSFPYATSSGASLYTGAVVDPSAFSAG